MNKKKKRKKLKKRKKKLATRVITCNTERVHPFSVIA